MAATVRSVTVRLNADVAGYIRDMKAAGAATDAAFDRSAKGLTSTTTGLAGADRQLKAVDSSAGSASRSVSTLGSNVATLDRNVAQVNRSLRSGRNELDSFSGRARLITEAAVIGGPAVVALGAVAIPAITGLAAAFGFAALGAGTLVAGFQGVGEAFDAVSKAQIEPTAENLEAAQLAMEQLSPAARSMVGELDRLSPALIQLRDASAEGIAPQMARGVDELLVGLPKLRGFFEETASAAASVLADGVGVLNADRWQPFLRFVEDQAPDAILQLGRIAGDVSFGFAELFRNMAPINNDVLGFLEDAADRFADFATNLEGSDGLRGFFTYLRETGPQVGEALGAMANAVLQIAQAAAPLSGPVLSAITGVSNAIAAIAGSDAGAPLVAMAAGALALNRALKVTTALAAAPALGLLFGGGATGGAAAARGGALAASGASGPVGLGVVAASLLAAPVSDLINQAKGYDGLKVSLEELGSTLRTGDLPEGFGALGEATRFLSDRNGFEGATDGINRFFDMSIGKLKESDDLFAGLDTALSDIAAQDGPKAASEAFEQLARNAGLSREEMGQAKAQLPGFSAAVGTRSLGELTSIFETLPGAIRGSTAAGSLFSRELEQATNNAYQFKTSLDDVDAALTRRSSARGYEAALDAANAALKENGRTLDKNTPKGRANAEALDAIGASAVNLSKSMKGVARTEFLKGAREDFIEAARGMGKTAAGAERLADKLGLIDRTKVDPKVFLDIEGFTKKTAQARADLLNLDRRKANPDADLNTTQFSSKQRRALNDVGVLDRQKPTPTAGMNDGPFRGVNARVMSSLNVTDRFTANPVATLQDNASGPARAIQGAIAAIQSKTVTVTVRRITTGIANLMPGAEGMMTVGGVKVFAGGGMDRADRHLPEFAGPGPTRVWREPETQGESYIPWADDYRRPRAKAIAEQTVALFGGEVEWYADGGMRGDQGPDRRGVRGDDVGRSARDAGKGLRSLTARLKDAEKAVEAERKQREKITNTRSQVVSSSRDLFRSDLFGSSDNPWASMSPFGTLQADIAGAREYRDLVKRLKRMGLDDEALAAGAGTLESARYLAGLGKSGVREFETLYDRRDRVSAVAGRTAGNAAYGDEVRQQTRELKKANQRLDRLEKAVKQADKNNRDGHAGSGDRTARALDGGANKARRRASGPGGRPS